MICSCPKCHAQIEVDLSLIPETGTFTPCPECKGRFWINKESFSRMALKKEGNTYCDQCGKELDHVIVCRECGVMYPDYYLVQASKPPRRQVEKPDLFSLSFAHKQATPTSYAYTYTGTKKSGERTPKVHLKRVGLLVIVALLAVGAGYFYNIKKSEQEYAKNFMRALFIIKSGTDLSLNTCAKISADWKSGMDAGQNSAPHISPETETSLITVKDATDKYLQKLVKPPQKYVKAQAKLADLYGVFTKVNALALAPSGSFPSFKDSANRSEAEFKTAVNELKASLPPELSTELKIAKTKFRGLQDL
jgi:uncharacterized protein YbaR (Trm112 family)